MDHIRGVLGVDKANISYEVYTLAQLALPVTITNLCFFGMSATDLIVVGHLGTEYLVAVAYAQVIMDFTLMLFSAGFNQGIRALCSQAYGARNYELLGQYTQLGCVCLSACCIPLSALWWVASSTMEFLSVAEIEIDYATIYMRLSVMWMWPRLMFTALSVYFMVQHIVIPTAFISIIFLFVNALLNVILVHGLFGWHGLGFEAHHPGSLRQGLGRCGSRSSI